MAYQAQCLCGRVKWQFTGQAQEAHHCHCQMCRKAHGAAYGSYYFIPAAHFTWLSDTKSVSEYPSSPSLTRTFCSQCGSVVPYLDDRKQLAYVPAGGHDDGPPISSHIFVASKPDWNTIDDELPQYPEYPPGNHDAVYATAPTPAGDPGVIRGSCLCGRVQFAVSESFNAVYNCYCQRCRRARAAVHTSNGFTSDGAVRFVRGADQVKQYKLPQARYFTQAFCGHCGAGLPRIDTERNIAVIPLGALDDEPDQKPGENIFCDYKPAWHRINNGLPNSPEGPGSG